MIHGLVRRPLALPLAALQALEQRTQITRHDCVEGWSAIGKWSGTPLRTFLQRIGRSGHALGLTPKGRLFALTRDELLECMALIRAINEVSAREIQYPAKRTSSGRGLLREMAALIREWNKRISAEQSRGG